MFDILLALRLIQWLVWDGFADYLNISVVKISPGDSIHFRWKLHRKPLWMTGVTLLYDSRLGCSNLNTLHLNCIPSHQ